MSFDSSRSANSGGSSKRTLDSTSSNTNKKRKPNQNQNQKTLGMAWGSNSRSSSKSSSRRSNFSDFGSYMEIKNQKLQDQFDADASNSSNSGSKPLFHGVSIFVDGFTVPSSQELRGYMVNHGGRFENYFSRSRVTHIICSNLPDSKVKNIRSFSRGLPVVKPSWILDSITANKLLNWVPYQLDQLVNEISNQPKLSAFFIPKTNLEDAKAPKIDLIGEEASPKCTISEEEQSCEVGESLEYSPQPNNDNPSFGEGNFSEVILNESTSAEEIVAEPTIPEPSSLDLNAREALKSSPCKSSASANCFLDQNKERSSKPRIASSSIQSHSTAGDPNFVENYFKNSRLHFIGTWRNRYRKRFPALASGNSTVNAATLSEESAVIHVDMDCFFVSVIIRTRPELQDKPVAVCHSDNAKGTAEISSANYPARDHGVKAGMFVRDAKALCPHLLIVPYDFEAYEVVADQFYDILHKHSNKVQAVSCDEAFLDVAVRDDKEAEHMASVIREEIHEATGCTASAGIAKNLLMARLATRIAKPNGQFMIPPEKVESFLDELPIKALPGIGHVLEEKLKRIQIQTCGQLRMISKESLQRDFGLRTGNMLWNYCRGIDKRSVGVVQETKSVGAEVNWGVRFGKLEDSQQFLAKLCNEVSLRLEGCGVRGRTITLKLKKKRKDAGEPAKFMGCGDCENLSRAITIPVATDDVDVLQRISKQLFGYFQLDVKEIRGVGLQVSRLENADMGSQGHERNTLKSWLSSASTNIEEPMDSSRETIDKDVLELAKSKPEKGSSNSSKNISGPSHKGHSNQSAGASLNQGSSLPHICDLDKDVVENLPPEIFSEMNIMYGGKLFNLLAKNENNSYRQSGSSTNSLTREVTGERKKGKESFHSDHKKTSTNKVQQKRQLLFCATCLLKLHQLPKVLPCEAHNFKIMSALTCSSAPQDEQCKLQEHQSASTSIAPSLNSSRTIVGEECADFMPTSLSQVDMSVLQQLPEELKVDILELLPSRRTEFDSCPVESSHDQLQMENNEYHMGKAYLVSRNSLWIGHPPEWVDKFEVSNHLILNLLADSYYKSGSTGILSSILQSLISVLPVFSDPIYDDGDDVTSSFCDLLRQYIDSKIKSDMEEIYICFRLLLRFTMKSRFLSNVYDTVLPYLQASFGENYGGTLNL